MLHVLSNRPSLTASDVGFATLPVGNKADLHLAFAALLASDPKVIRSRTAAGAVPGSALIDTVDMARALDFVNLEYGVRTQEVVDWFNSNGLIRQLYNPSDTAFTGVVSRDQEANHKLIRDPMVALRFLLLQTSSMPKLAVSKIDMLGSGRAGAKTVTYNWLSELYKRLFFRHSYTDIDSAGTVKTSVNEWCSLDIHPGEAGSFFGRILSLKVPGANEDYWRLHFLNTSSGGFTRGEGSKPSLIRDIIRMSILMNGDAMANPERLKSAAIDIGKLDREDQQRSTAELLAAHAISIGLLPYIVTDCYFEAVSQTPWMRPLLASSLERSALTGRFNAASATVAPFRRCGGVMTELWARLLPVTATVPAFMDKPHSWYGVPTDLWDAMMDAATYGAGDKKESASARFAKGIPSGDPQRKGPNIRALRINESRLVSSTVDVVTPKLPLDTFIANRLALADMLQTSDSRLGQTLNLVLADLGWTSAPVPTRSVHPSLFGKPVLSDGVYTTENVDIVDFRAARVLPVSEQSRVPTIIFSDSDRFLKSAYHMGSPIPRPEDMMELGLPQQEEPRDYAALRAASSELVDLDNDARIVPNTIGEWARTMNRTEEEFKALVKDNAWKWCHLFDISEDELKPRAALAITSSKIARLARSTILVGLPGGTLSPKNIDFANDAEDLKKLGSSRAVSPVAAGRAFATVKYSADFSTSQSLAKSGAFYSAFHDTADPAAIRCLLTWNPPAIAVDGMLEPGSRFDSIDSNSNLIKKG